MEKQKITDKNPQHYYTKKRRNKHDQSSLLSFYPSPEPIRRESIIKKQLPLEKQK